MKNIYITDFKTGEEIESFFMVKSIAVKMGSNKRNYMDILLGDNTGEIYGKKWNLADEEMDSAKFIAEGEVIKIRAEVTEWNSMKQLKISRIRKTNKEDDIQMSDYIKAAPEPPEEMYGFIKGKAQAMEDGDLKALCLMNLEDNQEKLLYYPAAQKNHHAEMAGLLWHIKRMIMTAEGVCLVYPHLDKDMVIAGVILHDMQKLYEINANEQGISDGYSFEGVLLGHLVMGIKVLDRQMESLGFPREKAIMVEHMILSHHYEPEFGSPKKPLFPEAELLHYLDMIDAKMYDMEDALAKTEPGEFSERVWTLDNRRLYKKQEEQK
ncbi:MAG: 3'-5' exoribonuclease YhaM family protein [Anaerovoracaceae bacterium]|jgi:3'-5' exoribonuclease